VIEQILEDCRDQVGVLIVGDGDKGKGELVRNAEGKGMRVCWWEDIWEAGEKAGGGKQTGMWFKYDFAHELRWSRTAV
jgi:hypothetical protein